MVASLQIGTAASYYARAYYHGGERELAATWFARGRQFGLAHGGEIDVAEFERLHAGLGEHGASLLTTKGREVAGLDLCFSPGKSVSLAYALTADAGLRAQILAAHHRAVHAALVVLNDEAIFARLGRGGLLREKVELTAALFTHDSARPEIHADGSTFADAQVHTHAVLFNLCERSNAKISAIDTRLGHWKLCAGAVYHSHLAYELESIGFAVQDIGYNGTFEIGFTPEFRAFFSSRRDRVVEVISEAGLTTGEAPELAAKAALRTRRAKQSEGDAERFEIWRAKARELGVDPDASIDALRQARPDQESARERLDRRLDELPTELTEREATFQRHELIRIVAASHVGTGADPAELTATAENLVTRDQVREIRRSPLDQAVYSTPEMIWIEHDVLRLAAHLADRAWSGIDRQELSRAATAAALSREQLAGAHSLTQPTSLAILEGRAGAGKTRTLRPVVEQLKAEGYRVIAAAPAWRTARMLADELDIEARAVDAWLATERSGGLFLNRQTVLLVDEAGQLGARAMHALLSSVTRATGTAEEGRSTAKLILVGDREQLQPMAAGAGLEIVSRMSESAELTIVQRQREPILRQAVEHLSRGEIAPAVSILEDAGCFAAAASQQAAVATAVETWFTQRARFPEADHLLLARSNASVRALNASVRIRRREMGEIGAGDVRVTAATASGSPFTLHLAQGDKIRFGVRIDALGVINGTTGTVENVASLAGGHARIVATLGGRQLVFSTADIVDRAGRLRLAHDYAVTIASSQGLTAESCTVLIEPTLDRHEFYVAASRARGQVRLVVDECGLDAVVVAESRFDDRKADVTPHQRRTVLIQRLSRSRHKTTTLEHDEETIAHKATQPSIRRNRRREPRHEL